MILDVPFMGNVTTSGEKILQANHIFIIGSSELIGRLLDVWCLLSREAAKILMENYIQGMKWLWNLQFYK